MKYKLMREVIFGFLCVLKSSGAKESLITDCVSEDVVVLKDKKILLVEDEPINREIILELIQMLYPSV